MISPIKIKKNIFYLILGMIFITIPQSSCKKLVEVNSPTTSISGKNVYTNDETATAVLTGIYSQISAASMTGLDLISIGLVTGLSADELVLYSGSNNATLKTYYLNNLAAPNPFNIWSNIYSKIYIVNLAIEGITNSTLLNPSVKQQLLGEAKFLRAFFFFYLVNLYGDVPLAITSDYKVNSLLARSSQEKVWTQIIADLTEAKVLLSPDYLDASLLKKTSERVRPTKWAAIALLSKSYLYTGDWKNAEIESSELIDNTSLYHLEDSLNNVFLMNNEEAIWQLQPVTYGMNTLDAKIYIIPSTGPSAYTPVYLNNHLLQNFESGDLRRTKWIDSVDVDGTTYYFPFKYQSATYGAPVTEYHTIFRLAEQYLVRAESRAHLNDVANATNDLNIIRKRAGLEEHKYSTNSALLAAIVHERQVELFTEWGNRWLDLKRTKTIDTVMSTVTPQKGGIWSSNWQLYPIPSTEVIADGNIRQNPGY
ncbi:RagB/SusD family nutrient uptake outer membrane protein [Chitinophaga sp. Ak27]|uniref:RagB/SusD family nutrient uptake outer membrane protein n=1 Tax=Chitinophaga sp. Ak27 TaxID=2726116 RepID=UPI00145FC19D|nr:RagB/SusD family nutrient uptake outer membrane protein [Chitinophaga sp. Ak27]NLU95762.1 RagB/SusD family nutrient uptake outer membrane protein [Chitinophaga sp. Ak27]